MQSYSKVWNAFSKWARGQLEQDRIINIAEFILLSSVTAPEDKSKQFIIGLTEKFLIKNSIEMEDHTDLSYPTIKLNSAAVAKLA